MIVDDSDEDNKRKHRMIQEDDDDDDDDLEGTEEDDDEFLKEIELKKGNKKNKKGVEQPVDLDSMTKRQRMAYL